MTVSDRNYFEHEADIGIIGYGDSLENAFINAAEAMFSIMADPKQIPQQRDIEFEFHEEDIEIAFAIWLNQLIARARSENLIFNHFSLTHTNNHWYGKAAGAPWDSSIEPGTEVKGATLTALSVKENNSQWQARCVVDV